MNGRGGKGPPTADLLVCFPTKAHLTLMPKPICSPSQPSDQSTHHHHRRHHHQLIKNYSNRGRPRPGSRANPFLWPKTKPNNSDISEPSSPKINCAGQIKVRPKPNSCKNWQSVMMKEIERIHKQKKRHGFIEALGFKKDVMQFLTFLRNIRFDIWCFGSFPSAQITSDEDEDEDESYRDNTRMGLNEDVNVKKNSMLTKWFMILEEKAQINNLVVDDDDSEQCAPPPPNALLLMRCRSAPVKSWLEEKAEEEKIESDYKKTEEEEKETEEADRLVVMRSYGTDFSKLSCDVVKETWAVGGIKDILSRSRSWKI